MSSELKTIFALTTKDNPFDPIDSYDEWYAYDISRGYNCSEYLARVAHTSPYLTPLENVKEIEDAIDEIIANDPLGIYKKVKKTID